jgi:hypothetical protein
LRLIKYICERHEIELPTLFVHCEPKWNAEKDNFAIYNTGVSLAKIVAIMWYNKYSAKATSSATLIRLHYACPVGPRSE